MPGSPWPRWPSTACQLSQAAGSTPSPGLLYAQGGLGCPRQPRPCPLSHEHRRVEPAVWRQVGPSQLFLRMRLSKLTNTHKPVTCIILDGSKCQEGQAPAWVSCVGWSLCHPFLLGAPGPAQNPLPSFSSGCIWG